jgi:hypothetical protein
MIAPNAQMQMTSGLAAAIRSRALGALTSGGWKQSIPSWCAADAAGGGRSRRPRP